MMPTLDAPPDVLALLESVGDIALHGASVGVAVFWVAYGVLFRWWSTGAGRSIFAFTGSLTFVLVLVIAARTLGAGYPGQEVARVLVYGACFATSWGMVIVLLRSWVRDKRDTSPTEVIPSEPSAPAPNP